MDITLKKNEEIKLEAGLPLDNPTNCLWWARFSNRRFQEALRIYTTYLVGVRTEHEARIIVRLVNRWCKRMSFTHPQLITAFRYEEASWGDWRDFISLELTDLQSALQTSLADNTAYHIQFNKQFLTFVEHGEIFETGITWARKACTIPYNL